MKYFSDQKLFFMKKDSSKITSLQKDSRYIKIVKFGLRITGLWKGPTDRSLNTPLVVLIQCFLFSAMAGTSHQLLVAPHDLNKVTELMMHTFFIVHTIITHFTLALKQQTILKILSLVENRFDNFSENHFKESKRQERQEENNARYIILIAVIISSVHFSFIITSNVYMVNLPPEQKFLLYPVSVPFEMTDTVYYIVYALQLITTFFEGTTHITSIAICTGFMNILCAEYTVLGKAFRQMGQLGSRQALQCSGSEVAPEWTSARHLDYHTQALLRSFVQHHILMINFQKELQATFAVPILEMFLNCQIMLCSCCFHIFKLYQEGEYEQVSKQLCMLIALLSHEFVYFWCGSRLTEKVQSFRYDVYACDWHERSPSFKRSYRIILERIKQGVTIQAFILPVSLFTFAKDITDLTVMIATRGYPQRVKQTVGQPIRGEAGGKPSKFINLRRGCSHCGYSQFHSKERCPASDKCLQAAFSYFNLLLALSYKQEKLLYHQHIQ